MRRKETKIDRFSTVNFASPSIIKQQFVVTPTTRYTDIPTSQRSRFTNSPSIKISSRKNAFSYIFLKEIVCLSVGLLAARQVLILPVKLCVGGPRQIAVSRATCCSSICAVIPSPLSPLRPALNYALPPVNLASSPQKPAAVTSFRLLP